MGPMLKDETDEAWDLVMDVNAKGVFNCLRAQVNKMEQGGCIVSTWVVSRVVYFRLTDYFLQVNAASVAGQIGQPGAAVYCASKAAVIGLTKSAARENPHLRINAVAPGIISTPMIQEVEKAMGITFPTSQQIMDRQGEPSEVASVIAFLLSEEASFITGGIYNIDGGFMA